MKLFKKKEKNKKVRDKQGCLTKACVALLFIGIIVFGTITGLNHSSKLFGETLSTISGYIEELNKPVKESELILNPVASYGEFQEQADLCGFAGYADLDGTLELNTTLTMQDNVFGALLSKHITKQEELISIAEFSITSENSLRIVFVYNLKDLKDLLSDAGDIIPSKMYITNTYTFTVTENEYGDNQISVERINTLLNQMEKTKSDLILSYLNGIESDTVSSPFKTYDNVLFKAINDIAIKTESTLSFTYSNNTGYINYVK